MNKAILKKAVRQSAFQLIILVLATFAGLAGISYILEPESVRAFFKDIYWH